MTRIIYFPYFDANKLPIIPHFYFQKSTRRMYIRTFTQISTFFLLFVLMTACKSDLVRPSEAMSLPAKTENGFQVVVEIPAGTNHKVEYDKINKDFAVDQLNGKDRIIDFLPYPGNYGFIPSTFMDPEQGGDGDALDVLVIAESMPTGTLVECIPVAVLLLEDRGEIDSKIIAVPLDPALRVMKADDFQSFFLNYDAARYIIEQWFLHYKGFGVMKIKRWEDDNYAWGEINRWLTAH